MSTAESSFSEIHGGIEKAVFKARHCAAGGIIAKLPQLLFPVSVSGSSSGDIQYTVNSNPPVSNGSSKEKAFYNGS